MIRYFFYLLFISIIIGALSCNNPFSDHIEKDEGVYMKLLSFEEGEVNYQPNKYVSAEVKIYNNKELIYRQFKEGVMPPKHQLAFLYHHLNEGDSAEFKVSKAGLKKFFPELLSNQNLGEYVTIYIKPHQYLSGMDKVIDPEMLERVLINQVLKEEGFEEHRKGIFTQQIKKGSGKKVKRGKVVTINYKGKFINQIEFDNTSSFTFTYGTPGQVIKGLEIALKGMREGEKSKIIIPSQLAFGEEGSSTQVVPPYATVIYELEIVNVK